MKINEAIANILRKNGSTQCIQRAELLEREAQIMSNLHLRNLSLNETDIAHIASILVEYNDSSISSISLSYNQLIGDAGVTSLLEKLPTSVSEIGLVDCGIGDSAGAEILIWMRKSQNLRMICMEQNNFSDNMKMEFRRFNSENPSVLVVY